MEIPQRPVFCLILEDNALVGLDLADALGADGYYVAGPFPSGREAHRWLGRFTPDVAIVDLTLTDGRCAEVIGELQARGIPFLIHSGCSARHSPLEGFIGVPWLEKPVTIEAIEVTLRDLLTSLNNF